MIRFARGISLYSGRVYTNGCMIVLIHSPGPKQTTKGAGEGGEDEAEWARAWEAEQWATNQRAANQKAAQPDGGQSKGGHKSAAASASASATPVLSFGQLQGLL
eukprot:1184881-Prorocentrum_minimum.AAC.4